MTAAVDDVVLGLLEAVPNLNVHDGYVTDSDEDAKVITAALPYVVYFTTPGYPVRARAGRPTTKRVTEFQVSAVGETREQALWASEKADAVLHNQVAAIDGQQRRIRRTLDNAFVRRDDTWTRPGGRPLFTAAQRYTLAGA